MAPSHEVGDGSPDPSSELSSGSVVFSLPHLRNAVFTFHRQALFAQRDSILAQIPRPMMDGLWDRLEGSNWYLRASTYYIRNASILQGYTKMFDILDALGLHPASWLDYVLARGLDAATWLLAYSHHRKSTSLSLQAYPQSRIGSGNAYETLTSDPMEMLLYGVTEAGYSGNHGLSYRANVPYFDEIFCDRQGRTFLARFTDPKSQPFLLDVAQRCPKLLYSANSPLFPVHEVLLYSQQQDAVLYVWQTPPWPLTRALVIGEAKNSYEWEKDELRRIIECARDLFTNLALLETYGISLEKEEWSKEWCRSLVLKESGPCLLPAYIKRSCGPSVEGKLSRMGHWDEQLPAPPQRPWPLTSLQTRTLSSSLPWSQTSAYRDPRVAGPTTFFHGIEKASWTEASAQERRAAWRRYGSQPLLKVTPQNRFNADLIVACQYVLRQVFFGHTGIHDDYCAKVLEAKCLSNAYQTWLEAPTSVLPRVTSSEFGAHSQLFTACTTCGWEGHKTTLPDDNANNASFYKGTCPRGHYGEFVSAIPAPMEKLLLRIIRPAQREDGSTDIVTAREAAEIMDDVLKTETPHLEALYNRWADAQVDDAPRLTNPADVRLPLILGDSSVHRWIMLELLRGNYLDEYLGRDELNKMRDMIKNDLTPLQQRKRDEFRAACGDVVAADGGSEEAGDQEARGVAEARPTRATGPAVSSSNAAGEACEAESSSSGATKGAKRAGGSSSKPAAAKKKSKKAK